MRAVGLAVKYDRETMETKPFAQGRFLAINRMIFRRSLLVAATFAPKDKNRRRREASRRYASSRISSIRSAKDTFLFRTQQNEGISSFFSNNAKTPSIVANLNWDSRLNCANESNTSIMRVVSSGEITTSAC